MKVTVDTKKQTMTIELPLINPPKPSSTGTTLAVASSRGNKETEVMIDGKPVYVGVNAYIYPGEKGQQ